MSKLRSLVVIVTALSLPSCAVYVHEGYPARHPCCARARASAAESRVGMIGISLAREGESQRGPLVVANVLPGSPAADAAIRPGDRIRAIDGEATRGMTIAEAARLIRGPVDAAVELRLESPRGARLMTLVRVPAYPIRGSRGCPHGRRHAYEDGRDSYETPPEAPAVDQSLAPELWPPTKPGHHMP
ncbi:MAG: PDZ domain-containing protein [Deltaproteobacteria bacterium]|nr:PDZ domain-containing protein [Deltaproteobacteria bacterium]